VADFTSYCAFVADLPLDHRHRSYHDTEYGFPSNDESVIFERLALEINQAGLSWDLILKRRAGFRLAFSDFDVETVAAYGPPDIERLLQDAGIIRNRMKIEAVIANANTILELRGEFGSFKGWIEAHHPRAKDEWVKLFKKTFKFTGGEIVNEFLMSLGYFPNAHTEACPVYHQALAAGARWRDA
jgi:DNA-3-methyladenine glycosylase I